MKRLVAADLCLVVGGVFLGAMVGPLWGALLGVLCVLFGWYWL